VAPAGALAGTLDQQQTVFDVGTGTIDSGETPAQTFTAGLTGGIDQVDLYIDSHGGPTTPVTIEIRDTSGGDPGATVLATQSVPAAAITAAGSWVTVNFTTPAPVTAGTQYAVLAYDPALSMSQFYELGYAGDVYAGGRFTYASSSPPAGPWAAGTTADLAFKTYVAPPQAATGQRAAALKKCKHKHSKKKRRKCRKKAKLLPL
jgi:hypothetical protein